MLRRLILFLSVIGAVTTFAQDTPRDGLRPLRLMIGKWEYSATRLPRGAAEVGEKGTAWVQEILDGTYLRNEWQVRDDRGGARQGVQHLTWNPKARRFELLTIYAGNAGRVLEVGKFDPASLTLHFQGEYVGRDGVVEQIRSRIHIREEEMTYENDLQQEDGSWHTDYRATYRRVKS